MIPKIEDAGPIIFIEDDEARTSKEHINWLIWLQHQQWADQRKQIPDQWLSTSNNKRS